MDQRKEAFKGPKRRKVQSKSASQLAKPIFELKLITTWDKEKWHEWFWNCPTWGMMRAGTVALEENKR